MGAPKQQRKYVQNSQESIAKLFERYSLNSKAIVKWKKRFFTKDADMGPKQTVLTQEEEPVSSLGPTARLSV